MSLRSTVCKTEMTVILTLEHCFRMCPSGFPGGAVVKNPPASAGDMGWNPGPGRYHMPQSN